MKENWCVPTAPRILILDTFFVSQKLRPLERTLNSDLYSNKYTQHESIMRYVRGCTGCGDDLKYLCQADLVLCPVHSLCHWSMVAIDHRKNVYRIYDSFYTSKNLPFSGDLDLLKVFFFSCSFPFCLPYFIIASYTCTVGFILTIKCMHFINIRN